MKPEQTNHENPNPNTKLSLIFIRHGESKYNQQAELLREKLGIGATWAEYKANPEFMKFKYSPSMMDCPLSNKGRNQCANIKIDTSDIDLILVSPLYRALETCSIVFKEVIEMNKAIKSQANSNGKLKEIPIIVDPLFSESLRCACDVSYNLPKAQLNFPEFDFSLLEGKFSSWYIENQTPNKQEAYQNYIKNKKAFSYEDIAECIVNYMEETNEFEDGLDLIGRGERARQALICYGEKNKSKKIAIVSHYYIIGHIINDASKFNEKGKPFSKFVVPNAEPIYFEIDLAKKNKY